MSEQSTPKYLTDPPIPLLSVHGVKGARVCYDPDWGRSRPFLTFEHGTAMNSFATIRAAVEHLTGKGYRFQNDATWR